MIRNHNVKRQPNTRSKRAQAKIMGNTLHYLFGTLDEDSEQDLRSLIEANSTRDLSNIVASQTEVIAEFGKTHDKITQLDEAIFELAESEETSLSRNVFSTAMGLLTENVLQNEIDSEMFTDAILFALQGMVHPIRLLPPEIIIKSERTQYLRNLSPSPTYTNISVRNSNIS